MRAAIAAAALSSLACAHSAQVPSSWSFRSAGAPIEADHATFRAAPPAVKAALEQELVKRGFTLAAAAAPYEIVTAERTDCGEPGYGNAAFELGGRCAVSGTAPICRRKGIAISLAPEAGGTSARLFVRSLAWREGDKIAASVDESFEACIPREEGEAARAGAIHAGPPGQARSLFESAREQLESGGHAGGSR